MKKDKRRLSALVFIILFCISVVAAAPFLVFGLLKDQEKSPDLPVLSDSYHLLMNTPGNADAPLLRPTGIDDATDETAQTTDSMVQTQVPPASTDAPTPPPKPPVLTGEPHTSGLFCAGGTEYLSCTFRAGKCGRCGRGDAVRPFGAAAI